MIKKTNDLYKEISDDKGLDYHLIKSVGDSVFEHLKEEMLGFKHGSIRVPYFGKFVVKGTRVERYLKIFLEKRAYMKELNPKYIERPLSQKIKDLFYYYLKVLIPYRKEKKAMKEKQLQIAKNLYENYTSEDFEILKREGLFLKPDSPSR